MALSIQKYHDCSLCREQSNVQYKADSLTGPFVLCLAILSISLIHKSSIFAQPEWPTNVEIVWQNGQWPAVIAHQKPIINTKILHASMTNLKNPAANIYSVVFYIFSPFLSPAPAQPLWEGLFFGSRRAETAAERRLQRGGEKADPTPSQDSPGREKPADSAAEEQGQGEVWGVA